MPDVILPRPDNVRGRFGTYVTSDVYHIAERLQEVSDRLYIQEYDQPLKTLSGVKNFVIVEVLPDGRETLVIRAETLDARLIEAVQRMRKIPFETRFAAMEKEEEKWAAEEKERQLDELYERMGGEMRHQLARCNFIDPWRPSYRPMNRTARRHRRYREVGR